MFLITPGLGSLTPGYLMLMPKRHLLSSANFNPNELKRYLNLGNGLREIMGDVYGINPIFWENGTGLAPKYSNCIPHSHTQVAAINFDKEREAQIIERVKLKKFDMSKINDLVGNDYLTYWNENGDAFYTFEEKPRQFMRQQYAEQAGKPSEWNWRESENAGLENIAKTIEQLKKPFEKYLPEFALSK
ncbi:MAG: hypothetical protein LBM01_00705 [Christensenellaceae bacterium]|jgi:diadenosine tetraphosphate (Ap4A) HIT family hydrolase|nr:hypothetical protein [Christensenellaceae bacterium]